MTTSISLRRTLLFVPGSEPKRIEKAKNISADTILFDLEDSVPLEKKEEARTIVSNCIQEGGFEGRELAVRINAPGSPFYESDLNFMIQAGVSAIMIPKSENAQQFKEVENRITRHEPPENPIQLFALIETPKGVLNLNEIAASSNRIKALCFGHADFSLEMGLQEANPAVGVVYHARCQVAMTAKAYGITPIDNVCLSVKDEETLIEDIQTGIQLGFEGKMCIHPLQVGIANDLYSPNAKQIEYAKKVVEGWKEAQKKGLGVFTVNHKMVDLPLVMTQEKVLEKAKKIGLV